jgi:hypothetical protein
LLSGLLALGLAGSAHAAVNEHSFIDSQIEVPAAVMEAVHNTFPERHPVSSAYLSPTFDPNLVISDRTSVSVTFLWGVTGYRNSFGYFTYRLSSSGIEILDRQLVFPNASSNKGTLQPGETATLRDGNGQVRYFEAGTRIGFFLVANGWNGSSVAGWNEQRPQLPSADPKVNAKVAHGVFTTVDALNPEVGADKPELARHTAMVQMLGNAAFLEGQPYFLVGMEDVRRDQGSDNDFNDVVFMVRSTVSNAFQGTHVLPVSSSNDDPDGDGVIGMNDFFPTDPTRATVASHPSGSLTAVTPSPGGVSLPGSSKTSTSNSGSSTTAFTDEVRDGAGKTKDVIGTFHRAHALSGPTALVLRNVPVHASGHLQLERFSMSGEHERTSSESLANYLHMERDGSMTFRYPELFRAGEGGSVRVVLTFDEPQTSWNTSSAFPWQLEAETQPAAVGTPAKAETKPAFVPMQPWSLHAGE